MVNENFVINLNIIQKSNYFFKEYKVELLEFREEMVRKQKQIKEELVELRYEIQ